MKNMRSAMTLLPELRDGRAMIELSEHIHAAIAAARQYGKGAKVILEIGIAPLKGANANVIEPPMTFTAEVFSKLPQPEPEATLMFVDGEGNPTRNATERQPGLGLTVAGAAGEKTA
jgi:hypothetical protein